MLENTEQLRKASLGHQPASGSLHPAVLWDLRRCGPPCLPKVERSACDPAQRRIGYRRCMPAHRFHPSEQRNRSWKGSGMMRPPRPDVENPPSSLFGQQLPCPSKRAMLDEVRANETPANTLALFAQRATCACMWCIIEKHITHVEHRSKYHSESFTCTWEVGQRFTQHGTCQVLQPSSEFAQTSVKNTTSSSMSSRRNTVWRLDIVGGVHIAATC